MCLVSFTARQVFRKALTGLLLLSSLRKWGAVDLKDFRPISLVGVVNKLMAKVLANRLKTVLGKIISETQNAFVKGKQIMDSVLIGNE